MAVKKEMWDSFNKLKNMSDTIVEYVNRLNRVNDYIIEKESMGLIRSWRALPIDGLFENEAEIFTYTDTWASILWPELKRISWNKLIVVEYLRDNDEHVKVTIAWEAKTHEKR